MSKEKVASRYPDAKLSYSTTYLGNMSYTVISGTQRLSVTRFSENAAWNDAWERISNLRPMPIVFE